MELTVEGHPSFHVEGSVTVELPAYMALLEPDELEEARTAENRDGLILAAGYHPNGRDLVFLTGAGELLELDAEKHKLPRGRAHPIDYGQTIRIDVGAGHEISNLWAIDNATSIIFLGAMVEPGGTRVSYVDR